MLVSTLMHLAALLIIARPAMAAKDLPELAIEAKEAEETTWYGSKYYLAPITVPIDVYQKLQNDQPTEGILREDGRYLIGWSAIVVAGKYVERQYTISVYDFNRVIDNARESSTPVAGRPQKILFVADDNGIFNSFYNLLMRKTHPDIEVTTITARFAPEALAKMRQLPQNAQFDRIDWSIHGGPGEISETALRAFTETEFKQIAPFNLIRADGEMRMLSCAIAQDGICKRSGESFVSEIGRVFLPKGGSIFASTKDVNATFFDNSTRPALTRAIEAYAQGPGHLLSLNRLIFNPLNALPVGDSHKYDILEIERSAASPDSCSISFAALAKWHSR